MKPQDVIALLVLSTLAIAATYDIWLRPEAFLQGQRKRRARAYASWMGFLARNPYFKGFDRSPGMDDSGGPHGGPDHLRGHRIHGSQGLLSLDCC